MVPDKSFQAGTWWEYSKTVFSISYLIMGTNKFSFDCIDMTSFKISGMIILSMCFSLIGEVVESKVKAVADKMGLGKEKICFDSIITKERIAFDLETSEVHR